MKQHVTVGVVLARINFGEADRIITVLTPHNGKIRLLAKGVRKIKSRLAGGIELLSINDMTYMEGKSGMGTLISSRLNKNYGNILKDVDRTMYAYEILKLFNKITEDYPEEAYFDLLCDVLVGMNNLEVEIDILRLWVLVQILALAGHGINLTVDARGGALLPDTQFAFSIEDVAFTVSEQGMFNESHIKILRLAGRYSPSQLARIANIQDYLPALLQLVRAVTKQTMNI